MIYTDGVHLITDSNNIKELHDFALKIGLKLTWFQNKGKFLHYDLISPNRAEKACKEGAILLERKDLLKVYRNIEEPKPIFDQSIQNFRNKNIEGMKFFSGKEPKGINKKDLKSSNQKILF